jgi:hypothetical protein
MVKRRLLIELLLERADRSAEAGDSKAWVRSSIAPGVHAAGFGGQDRGCKRKAEAPGKQTDGRQRADASVLDVDRRRGAAVAAFAGGVY